MARQTQAVDPWLVKHLAQSLYPRSDQPKLMSGLLTYAFAKLLTWCDFLSDPYMVFRTAQEKGNATEKKTHM